jgi:hypothetical protein
MATPPPVLPGYVSIEGHSEWLNTALTCSALETSLLPTRLTAQAGRQGTFTLFESVLNTNGRQSIFELGATLPEDQSNAQNGHGNGEAHNAAHVIHQSRGQDRRPAPAVAFDINFSATLAPLQKNTCHIFGQIITRRHSQLDASAWEAASPQEDRMPQRSEDEAIVEM